jgi:hypothetical protein
VTTDHLDAGQPFLHDRSLPQEVHMSTHADPSKDEYLELEKKLGAAEYELAEGLAETDKALDTAVTKGKKRARTASAQLKRKAAAGPRKHDPDGLRR